MFKSRSSRAQLLLTLSVFLSWSWLLPNHYQPWPSFHMDAWAAIVFFLVAFVVLYTTQKIQGLASLSFALILLSCVPWVQYLAGLVTSPSLIWMPFIYLLGSGITIEIGRRWQRLDEYGVNNFLYLSIGIAAICSVGWQLNQWLQRDLLYFWSMGGGDHRPYANMGQPNQLGTLLLWGMLAIVWGWVRGQIGLITVVATSLFLGVGVALTESRAAVLGYFLILMFLFIKRKQLEGGAGKILLCWVIFGVTAILFYIIESTLSDAFFIVEKSSPEVINAMVQRLTGESRPVIWKMLLEALLQQPIFGFGWGQLGHAQLIVGPEVKNIPVLIAHAHNIFLDLMLWNGVPLGLLINVFMAYWVVTKIIAVKNSCEWLMLAPVLVFFNHSMLELPHQYIYFLLPIALWVGAVEKNGKLFFGNKRFAIPVFLGIVMISILSAFMVYDYFRIEKNFWASKYNKAGFAVDLQFREYRPLFFTHLQDYLLFDGFNPTPFNSSEKIEWMKSVTTNYPSTATVHKFAAALAWSGRKDEARMWLDKICRMSPPEECINLREAWERQAQNDKDIDSVAWGGTKNAQ